jgi:hypothetical protein
MFKRKFEEKIKNIFYIQYISSENLAVYEIMWKKYGRGGQATDDIMLHRKDVLCVPNK